VGKLSTNYATKIVGLLEDEGDGDRQADNDVLIRVEEQRTAQFTRNSRAASNLETERTQPELRSAELPWTA